MRWWGLIVIEPIVVITSERLSQNIHLLSAFGDCPIFRIVCFQSYRLTLLPQNKRINIFIVHDETPS